MNNRSVWKKTFRLFLYHNSSLTFKLALVSANDSLTIYTLYSEQLQ